jgi:hypothetical protein
LGQVADHPCVAGHAIVDVLIYIHALNEGAREKVLGAAESASGCVAALPGCDGIVHTVRRLGDCHGWQLMTAEDGAAIFGLAR